MRQAAEPSVEEILDSIKKVIARDNRADAADERRDREERGISTFEAQDALEDDDEEVLELEAMAEAGGGLDEPDPALINPGTVSSMRESLAALSMLSQPGAAPQIVRSGETSLEALTRDLLRPALAEWLEKNLPPLVERMVSAEIARIVGKKG